MKKVAQNKMILNYLMEGNSITPLEALNKFGCLRLGARIFDIQEKFGVKIEHGTAVLMNGKRVGKYWISKQERG